MEKKFYVYNSFTEQPYLGNPAGVVPDADDLTTEQMQAIAKQLNLVETVFILKAEDTDNFCRLRYFSPLKELPIAGHPTIAAWHYLRDHQLGVPQSKVRYIQETGAGNIEISFQGEKIFASQQRAEISVLENIDLTVISEIFQIDVEGIDLSYPIAAVDAGLGHLVFAVKSLDVLLGMSFGPEALQDFCRSVGVRECQIFCFETYDEARTAHTRNLCPRHGLEDPACGNGSAALAAYFLKFVNLEDKELSFEQGHIVKMDAVVDVMVEGENIYIGGAAQQMIEGQILVSEKT